MPKILEEYRRKTVKTITTPNGLTVKVRVLTSTIPFLKLVKKYGLEKPEQLDPLELAERSEKLQHELFKENVLEPKIDRDLGFDEIFAEDKAEIFNAILGGTYFRKSPSLDSEKSSSSRSSSS
jgi:hypothetical protein